MWTRIVNHLLPRAKAWRLAVGTQIRQFVTGIADGVGPDAKLFVDQVWLDIFPDTTRELGKWESQFNIVTNGDTTDAERRVRLTAAWQALGGQSPRYIQDTLQAAGFDVYVHEWWVPGTLHH